MPDEQNPKAGSDAHHVLRDLFLSAVIAGGTGVAPVAPTQATTDEQVVPQRQPAPERSEAEIAHAAEFFKIKQEQELERALDLGTILNAPEQIEERPSPTRRDER
jgi:hypothetical protein